MKYLAGALALAALCAAGPEADPVYPYPYPYSPYYASGYAGPLPGASYQAVHRLHKREAEADPQILLNAAPFAPLAAPAPLPIFAPAHAVVNTPVVKSVVEQPAEVAHTVVATHHVVPAAPLVAPIVPHVSASGYAGPLPGNSYQAVNRLHLHKREAEADPQFLLNAAPFAPLAAPAPLPAPIFAPAHSVVNAPVVKSVVEQPPEVAHTVHATHHVIPTAPLVAPVVHHAAPLI